MVQSLPSGRPRELPVRLPTDASVQKPVDQQTTVKTPTPESATEPLADNQIIDNQTRQRAQGTTNPTEVTFSPEALDQIKAWGSLKYNAGTDMQPNMVAFDPAKIEQTRIAVLDRNGDGQISLKELSFNGDGIATQKELEYLLQQGINNFQRSPETTLNVKPVAIKFQFTGPAMAEFNNPETNTKFGSQGRLEVPLRDGKANAFVYGNKGSKTSELRKKNQDTTHSLLVRNPSQTQPLLLKLNASFINKMDKAEKTKYQSTTSFISGQKLIDAPEGTVRMSDYELSGRMLNNAHQLQNQYVLVPPGGTLDLRSSSQLKVDDFRAFYQIEALADYPDDYTGSRNAQLAMPESVQMESVLLPTSENPSRKAEPVPFALNAAQSQKLNALIKGHGYVEDISQHGERRELKGALDFQNPAQAIRAMEKELQPQLSKLKPTAHFSQAEIEGLKTRFRSLLDAVKQEQQENPQSPLSNEILDRMNDWNAELKMTIRVLDARGNNINSTPLWKSVIPLGRVVGIKEHSEAKAELPTVVLNGSAIEANYSLLMNPLNRAGTDGEPDLIPMLSSSPNAVPPSDKTEGTQLVPPDKSYGQYGVKYEISFAVHNTMDTPQPFDIRFGTTDEQGHADWQNLFDAFDAYLKPDQARFTGPIRITINGEAHQLNIAHGKVQAPESLMQGLNLSPGEHQIQIEMVVPTNNTGPHLLQLLSQPSLSNE